MPMTEKQYPTCKVSDDIVHNVLAVITKEPTIVNDIANKSGKSEFSVYESLRALVLSREVLVRPGLKKLHTGLRVKCKYYRLP